MMESERCATEHISIETDGHNVTEIQARKTTKHTTTRGKMRKTERTKIMKCSFNGIKCNLHVMLDFQCKLCFSRSSFFQQHPLSFISMFIIIFV